MNGPTQAQIESLLIGILSDGFNRSLSALSEAGAVDTTQLAAHYKGQGSKYYDLVTAQIEITARAGASALQNLFSTDPSTLEKT